MEFLKWDDKYSVHVPIIDFQHKKLFAIISELEHILHQQYTKQATDIIITKLLNYSHEHFRQEEMMMQEYGFPGIEKHRVQHERFSRRIQDFQRDFRLEKENLNFEILNFLKDWLIRHVLDEDRKYIPYFRK